MQESARLTRRQSAPFISSSLGALFAVWVRHEQASATTCSLVEKASSISTPVFASCWLPPEPMPRYWPRPTSLWIAVQGSGWHDEWANVFFRCRTKSKWQNATCRKRDGAEVRGTHMPDQIGKRSSSERGSTGSALYWLVVVMTIVQPLSGLISPYALLVPISLAALMSVVVLAQTPRSLQRIGAVFKDRTVVALLAAVVIYLLWQQGRQLSGDPLWILPRFSIAVAVFLCLVVACVFRSEIETVNSHNLLTVGVMCAVAAVGVLSLHAHVLISLVPVDKARHWVASVRELNRFLEILSCLSFVAAAAQSGRYARFALLMPIALWAVSFFVFGFHRNGNSVDYVPSETIQYGVPIALSAVLVVWAFGRFGTHLVFTGLGVHTVLAPWIYDRLYDVAGRFPLYQARNVLDRVDIWAGTAELIKSASWWHFLFGRGIEYLRSVPPPYMVRGEPYAHGVVRHPHNAVLQLWLDVGLVGVVLFLWLGWYFFRLVASSPPSGRAALAGSATMIMIVLSVTHSAWQPWMWAGLAGTVICARLIAAPRPNAGFGVALSRVPTRSAGDIMARWQWVGVHRRGLVQ